MVSSVSTEDIIESGVLAVNWVKGAFMKFMSGFMILASVFVFSSGSAACDLDCFSEGLIKSMNDRDYSWMLSKIDQGVVFGREDVEYMFNKYSGFFEYVESVNYLVFPSFGFSHDYNRDTLNTFVFYKGVLPDNLDWDMVGVEWGKKILCLDVYSRDGRWVISETPFYLFRDVPWSHYYD